MTPHWAPSPVTTQAGGRSRDARHPAGRPSEPRRLGSGTQSLPTPPELEHQPSRPTVGCTLGALPESVRAARDFARAALADWGMAGLTDIAELVVSELVTNALRHGVPSARRTVADQSVRLRLLAQGPLVMCMVSDPGSDIPIRRESGPEAESGRGLTVVDSCCARWGWHLLDDGGKVVWALLRPDV